MRHSKISITEKNQDIIAFSAFSSYGTNKEDINTMKRILSKALSQELTERQKECIELYYFRDMKMKDIAAMLSVSPSTVTRHIKAAKRRLIHVAQYY